MPVTGLFKYQTEKGTTAPNCEGESGMTQLTIVLFVTASVVTFAGTMMEPKWHVTFNPVMMMLAGKGEDKVALRMLPPLMSEVTWLKIALVQLSDSHSVGHWF